MNGTRIEKIFFLIREFIFCFQRTEGIAGNKKIRLMFSQDRRDLEIVPIFPKQWMSCLRTCNNCDHIRFIYEPAIVWAIKNKKELVFGMVFNYSFKGFID